MRYYIQQQNDDVNNPNLEVTLTDRRPRTDEYSPHGGFATKDAAFDELRKLTADEYEYPANYADSGILDE